MGLTLTYKEFESYFVKARTAYIRAVGNRHDKMADGCVNCDKGDAKINELFIYLWIFSQWKQDNFNWELYNNCITSEEIYEIFARIEKLS